MRRMQGWIVLLVLLATGPLRAADTGSRPGRSGMKRGMPQSETG